VDGESLFNDATAIVTFSIFLYVAQHPAEDIGLVDATLRFGVVFFGGVLTGLLVGLAFVFMSRLFHDPVQQGIITLVSAYAAYLLAEDLLLVSGGHGGIDHRADHGACDPLRLPGRAARIHR
jgi:CPA1 family monovalent cation:H+ antiporter